MAVTAKECKESTSSRNCLVDAAENATFVVHACTGGSGANINLMRHFFSSLFVMLGLTFSSCAQRSCVIPADYMEQQALWRQARMDELLSPMGWIALVGLYWLSPGDNTFGSDPSNKIVFPEGAPAYIGLIRLDESGVGIRLPSDGATTVSGRKVLQEHWGKGTSSPTMENGVFRWTVIRRGDRYGIRLWDTSIPTLIRMQPIPHFPEDTGWMVEADWQPAAQPDTLTVQNKLGMDVQVVVPGSLVFSLQGERHSLRAIQEGKELLLIFTDETSGELTYPAGRYLYATMPATASRLCLDFNRSFNPPCAFTEYATCLLPLPGNHLPFTLTAGEQYHGN